MLSDFFRAHWILRLLLATPLALVVGHFAIFTLSYPNAQPRTSSRTRDVMYDNANPSLFSKTLTPEVKVVKPPEPRLTFIDNYLRNHSRKYRENRVDCDAIIRNDKAEIARGYSLANNLSLFSIKLKQEEEDAAWNISHAAKNCPKFIKDYGFITYSLTEEEKNFPIAYSLLTYHNIVLLVRLLAAVYRPQNYYCIHVDQKASEKFRKAITSIMSCLHNVHLPKQPISVKWGDWSIIAAEIKCMEELYRYRKWKYFINLTGEEFPLKTNFELVRILTAYGGANDVDGSYAVRRPHRWEMRVNTTVPPGIKVAQGSTHIAVNRQFIKFVLFSDMGKAIRNWLEPTLVPDETVFATINHNPHLGIKGSYKGLADTEELIGHKPFYTRYKHWYSEPCARKTYNGVCGLTLGDLHRMIPSPYMIANKFKWNEDRVVISCLEEWLANRTLDFYTGDATIDTTFYANSVIVQNMLPMNETIEY